MANTLQKDVILNLEIGDSEAVTIIAQLTKKMDELKVKQQLLNSSITDLNKKRREHNITEAEYVKRLQEQYEKIAKNELEIKMTKESLAAYNKELKNNIIQTKAADDSIESMRARLANMRKQYEQLSKTERENPLVGGKQLQDIKQLTDELKVLEKQQGDTRRSVGDYASAFDASTESITRFGSILGNIFGGNGIIGKAATVVVGFGRNLKDFSKETVDMANSVFDTATKVESSTKIIEGTAKSIGDVGTEAENTTKTVQGFGKALYETENVEETATKATFNMAKATGGISGAFKSAGAAVKSFGKELMALLANPVVLTITGIVLVLMKLADQFKKNDEAMTALQSVFAAFKPILDLVNRAFQAIVEVLGKALAGIGNFLTTVMSVIPGLKNYAAAEQDVVKSTDALEESERKYTVNHSKREKEIAELNAMAADSETYSFKERKEFMEQAAKLEEEDLVEAKANAEEKLRIRRQEMAMNMGFAEFTEEVYMKMSDEMKDELANLEAMVNNAEKAYNDGMRSINKKMSSFTKQEESEQKARAKAAADSAKERLKNEEEALKKLKDLMIKGIADIRAQEYSIEKENGERAINDLKKRLAEEKNLTKKARAALNEQIILMEADLQLRLLAIRKAQNEEEIRQELENAKSYYENLLKGFDAPELTVPIQLQINKIDTDLLIKELQKPLDDAKKVLESATKDFNDTIQIDAIDETKLMKKYGLYFDKEDIDKSKGALEALSQLVEKYRYDSSKNATQIFKDATKDLDTYTQDISDKYSAVFENYGISGENALMAMKELLWKYQNDVLKQETLFTNQKNAVLRAGEKEEQRIRLQGVKDTKDAEDEKYSIAVKHQELMNELQNESDLELFTNNEVEKAKIMQRAAEERLQIAKNEYDRLLEEREKFTDEELEYMYGSVEAYDNKLLESSLKVINANKEVEKSMADVAEAQKQEKIKIIDNVTQIIEAIGKVADGFQQLFEVMAEDNAAYADFATAMAMVQILTNAAVATAQAVSAAVNAGMGTGMAAPATIPVFIAELVSIVTSSIASAISLLKEAKSAKTSTPRFAEGGLVGNRTTNRKDDTVNAKLSEGEYVIKSDVVSKYGVPFFDFINYGKKMFPTAKSNYAEGGSVSIPQSAIDKTSPMPMSEFKAAMVEALEEMPNPIVSVKEISSAQKRVKIKETIATAK